MECVVGLFCVWLGYCVLGDGWWGVGVGWIGVVVLV